MLYEEAVGSIDLVFVAVNRILSDSFLDIVSDLVRWDAVT